MVESIPPDGFELKSEEAEEGGIRKTAHAGSRTRVTSMGGLYDAATLHALLMPCDRQSLHITRRAYSILLIAMKEAKMPLSAT